MEGSFLGTRLSPVVDGVSVVALGETLRMETVLPLLLVRGHCAVQVVGLAWPTDTPSNWRWSKTTVLEPQPASKVRVPHGLRETQHQ
jgi:hypothetical protein